MSQQAASPDALFQLFIPLGVVFLVFYVFVFRPQTKTQKEHDVMLKSLKKHDAVVTRGGLIGTVVNLKPDTLTLRVDDNVRIEVERAAVVRLLNSKDSKEKITETEQVLEKKGS